MKTQRGQHIQKRIDTDLIFRSTFAALVYCAIFPAIFLPFNIYSSHPVFAWSLTLSATIISAVRYTHIKFTDRFYEQDPKLWVAVFKTCSLSHAAILSTMFAIVTHNPDYELIYIPTLVVCAGMASAAISSLSPNLFMTISYPSILLIPTIGLSFLQEKTQSNGTTISLYLLYLILLGYKTHKGYMRSFNIEETLQEQKRELIKLSQTDALTGLFNRGHFNTIYQAIWDSCVRNRFGITLILIDVDYFKKVNDTYGHISGDACLIQIAKILKDNLKRETDICCRYGGEEFALLLNSTPIETAENIAEKMRQQIESALIEHHNHRFQVTASFGLAHTLPDKDANSVTLIENADQALYRAKRLGRNRVSQFANSQNTN